VKYRRHIARVDRPIEFSARTNPANHWLSARRQSGAGVVTHLSPLRWHDSAETGVRHLDYPLNANRQRQATVAGLQAGQEPLSATLLPVGQQNSDHVLFEKLKNGNPPCLYAWPNPITLLGNFLTDYRFLSQ
jgi:hypothetical protein